MNRRTIVALLPLAAALGGCVAVAPATEASLGDASRALRAQQLIDPAAPVRHQGVATRQDGRAALEATDRYLGTYKEPAPANVIAIPVGAGATSNGR
jgi:hypothetical protein